MAFKWFKVMIKTRWKCGANYEIMQINEKYSVGSQTKRNGKEIKTRYSRLRSHQKPTTHYFFMLCRIFCSFYCRRHRYTRHNLLWFKTSTNMFGVTLVWPLEPPTKKGRRDKWKTFSVNFAVFFLFVQSNSELNGKEPNNSKANRTQNTHTHPINHLPARANISRHNSYADLHILCHFVFFGCWVRFGSVCVDAVFRWAMVDFMIERVFAGISLWCMCMVEMA